MTAPPVDVHTYYRQVTDVDIGEIVRELLGDRITQESRQTLFCDCPNHRSQSHRSLHVWLDKQGWFCHSCGTGGDVLQLVEFVRFGVVTRGQSGSMPDDKSCREEGCHKERLQEENDSNISYRNQSHENCKGTCNDHYDKHDFSEVKPAHKKTTYDGHANSSEPGEA